MAEGPFGHEPSGVAVRPIAGLAVALAAFVIATVWMIDFSLKHWILRDREAVVSRRAAIPPPPRLQPNPAVDVERLREEKETLLSSWQWTDSTQAFARIPIERAMTLYVAQHRPAADTTGPASRPP